MYLQLFSVVFFASTFSAVRFDGPEQCSWLPDNTDSSSSKLAVSCRVVSLEESTNISSLPAEVTSKLLINCSEGVFFESVLPSKGLHRLHELEELKIVNCKLLSVKSESFEGLYNVKRLSINTFNSKWGSTKSLDLARYSLRGLKELQVLDLGYNNIRNLPDGVFCSLTNLQTLNLTRNRIKSTERLGINVPSCSNSDLKKLDLSYNSLKFLPEDSGFSRFRRLQHLNFTYNNISEISGEALTGLDSLKSLNFANNKIGMLPQGLFSGTPELKEIQLQNNSLFSLAKGTFRRLEQLLVLDLSLNQLTSNHIDTGTFSGLIRLIVLNISHNALTRIDKLTFKDLYFLQILDLKNNSIGFIEENSFLPLYNLHTLNLSQNRLNTIGEQLFNGLFVLNKLTLSHNLIVTVDSKAFRNCSALKDLDLSSNVLSEVPDAIQELTFLKTLDLGENQISEFGNGSFKNLNQLTGLRMMDNKIGNITQRMLWDLTGLQVLNLAKNNIEHVQRGSFDRNTQIEAIRLDQNFLTDVNGIFATVVSLLWLNLSDNHIVWFDYAFIPSSLKWLDIHGNLIVHLANYFKIQDGLMVKTVDVSHNRLIEISPMAVPDSVELLFINNNFIRKIHPNTFLKKKNLIRVDMYSNELNVLDLNALRLSPVPLNKSLPQVYLGGNPFHCDCTMEWLQLINNMSASRQYPKVMDLQNVLCEITHHRGVQYIPMDEAKPSDFLCPYETHCFALCHCCDFDACDCEMTCPNNCSCYHDQTWSTNIVDCSGKHLEEIPHRVPMDATELYLDGNDLKELQNHVFIGRKNMRILYVNNSGVETIQNSTFNGLNALQSLHLEDNKIEELEGYEFENLSNLKELFLQNNLIWSIANNTMHPLTSLEVLRLDGNKLVTFPVWQLSTNTRLTVVNLGNNKWSCRCKFLNGLTTWVADNAVKVMDSVDIMCYDQEAHPPQHRELNFNSTACNDISAESSVIDSMLMSDYWPMVIVSLCTVIFLLLGIVLWFVFGEPVKVWLYSRYGVRLCSFGGRAAKNFEDRDKLFDGFVCYSPKDEEWVVQVLAVELEPKFQLCLHYRDLPHAYIQQAAPAVLEAAEASRRVLLVLTRNFMQTEWSRFELRQALHEALKSRVFKLVILEEEPLPEADLDPEIRLYLKTAERIRWSDKHFWEKLKYAMPSIEPKGKINANYKTNTNNYTMESRVVVNTRHHPHHQYREKNEIREYPNIGMEMMPPAYSSDVHQETDDANYSSATTATPSPRSSRRAQEPRPLSDHIYSSIDSDYSTLERGGSGRHGPPWRHQHIIMQGINHGGPAYLV